MEPASKLDERYTYMDYSSWPENERWELINGETYALATPTAAHQSISMSISNQLYSYNSIITVNAL